VEHQAQVDRLTSFFPPGWTPNFLMMSAGSFTAPFFWTGTRRRGSVSESFFRVGLFTSFGSRMSSS
jgi:hypothetical protein